jgi:hypothetical protein
MRCRRVVPFVAETEAASSHSKKPEQKLVQLRLHDNWSLISISSHRGVGRGCGVGRSLGVTRGVALGVAVAVGVGVGVGVGPAPGNG